MLSRRVPWANQPYDLVGIDWHNPFSKSLQAAVLCGQFGAIEVISQRPFSRTGTTGIDVAQPGRVITTASGSTDVWSLTGLTPLCSVTDKLSWVVGAYSTTTAIVRKRAIRFSHNTAGTIVNTDFSDGTSDVIQAGVQVSGVTFAIANGQAQVANKHWFLGYSYDTNNASTPYLAAVDGVARSVSTVNPSSNNLANSIDQIFIGNSGSGFPLQGGVSVTLFWNRRLSQDELNAITANPWQVFRP